MLWSWLKLLRPLKLESGLLICGVARVQGLKGASEDDMEAVLDRVMMLFRYLQEKDVFEKYYKQHLAKRLLSGRTARPQPSQGLGCLPSCKLCRCAASRMRVCLGSVRKAPLARALSPPRHPLMLSYAQR